MYAQHCLENKHFVRSMEDIMEVLQIRVTRKGSIINTSVKFHIYIYIYIYIYTHIYIYIYIMKQNLATETKISKR